MKGELVVKNLLEGSDLVLEVGESVIELTGILSIRVDFPEVYTTKDLTWDETGNHIISEPVDYIFKETSAFLELEMPVERDLFVLLDQTIRLDSDEELTNFYVAGNHYPTFDDEILITCDDSEYILIWKGTVPDIRFADFEQSMLNGYQFILTTTSDLVR